MRQRFFILLLTIVILPVVGCSGNKKERTDYTKESPEVERANDVRLLLKEDIFGEGGKIEVDSALENLEETKAAAESEGDQHVDVYQKIYDGMLELKKMVDGRKSRASIRKKIQELTKLTEVLPGKLPEQKTYKVEKGEDTDEDD